MSLHCCIYISTVCSSIVFKTAPNPADIGHVSPTQSRPASRRTFGGTVPPFLQDVPRPATSWKCPAILYECRMRLIYVRKLNELPAPQHECNLTRFRNFHFLRVLYKISQDGSSGRPADHSAF